MGHRKGNGNGSRKGQGYNRSNDRMSKPHVGSSGRRNCFGDAPTIRRKTVANQLSERGYGGALLRGS